MLQVRCLNARVPAGTWESAAANWELWADNRCLTWARLAGTDPKPKAARINLTGHCFIQADVLNGAPFAHILYLSRCVKVGSAGGRWAQAPAPLAGLGAPGAADGDPVAQERVAKNKSLLFPVIFK